MCTLNFMSIVRMRLRQYGLDMRTNTELSTFDLWNIQIYDNCQCIHKSVVFNTHNDIQSFISTPKMAKKTLSK